MPTITLDAASAKLTHAVERMRPDDVLQIYNELFPEEPASENKALEDIAPLAERIVVHISEGLEPEEVADLWSVAFPRERKVYYNEQDDLLHYGEGAGREADPQESE